MTLQHVSSADVIDVAIIGAGPYGLSIAAHLRSRGVLFRIFGDPMSAWSKQMPKGMRLKSEGFASSLSDPASKFTLRDYSKQEGLPYADMDRPVPLETFVSYGLAFQKKFVPNLERKMVESVHQSPVGFELSLENGEKVFARNVVVAVGIAQFAQIPATLTALPGGFVSHSSAISDLEGFRGREVAVVGAGASALDLTALLHQGGASVHLIARSPIIRFHDPPARRSLQDLVLKPKTGIGSGMQLLFYVKAPLLFRYLPEALRLDRVRKVLGPAPAWFIRDQVVGKVPLHLGVEIADASVENGRVRLRLSGEPGTLDVDHVIAATGYHVDLRRLFFLEAELRKRVRLTSDAPLLSSNFESSVSGLYFVGVIAANSFGPMMRFAYGCSFVARRLSRHLMKLTHRKLSSSTEFGMIPTSGPTHRAHAGLAAHDE